MNVTSRVATVPGWYGKLPTLGDFASRRLEADFIEPWDLWLGEAMQAQRSAFGEGWLDAYLDTPPWRFLLSPGTLSGVSPGLAFAGVLVPSVDRVGRHFPLTLVASLARVPDLAAEFDALLAWLHRLEDTALDALQGDWTIDDLENALAELSPPADEASASFEDRLATMRRAVADALARRGGFVDIAGVSSRADLAAIFSGSPTATVAPRPPLRGLALWIADTPGRPQLLVSDGLPSVDEFVRMFAGGHGSRSTGAPRNVRSADEEDPMATLPQGLGPPLLAALPQAGRDDDLLSMFGNPAPAPDAGEPPRDLLPDDDILALFKVDAEPVVPAAASLESIPENDPLGLFGSSAEPSSGDTPPRPAMVKDDDILAMFHADAETAPAENGRDALLPADDLLGLFEVPPETVPFGESPVAAPRAEGTSEPDILDMFGGSPAKPEDKEAK